MNKEKIRDLQKSGETFSDNKMTGRTLELLCQAILEEPEKKKAFVKSDECFCEKLSQINYHTVCDPCWELLKKDE